MKFLGILFVIITYAYAPIFSMAGGESKTGTLRRLIEDDKPADLEELLGRWHIDDAKDAINQPYRPPLNCAVNAGRAACVRVLLVFKPDPNSLDEFGRSALFRAAQVDGAIVRLLLGAGAAHIQHLETGEWPVHVAAHDGLRFVSRGKDMPAAAEPTPEVLRTSYRPDTLCALLEDDTISVNLRARAGSTPLHCVMDKFAQLRQSAVSNGCPFGSPDYVSLQEKYLIHIYWLVLAGANCVAVGIDGKTPIMLADESQHEIILREIARAHADRRARLVPLADQINLAVRGLPRELEILIADFMIQL